MLSSIRMSQGDETEYSSQGVRWNKIHKQVHIFFRAPEHLYFILIASEQI